MRKTGFPYVVHLLHQPSKLQVVLFLLACGRWVSMAGGGGLLPCPPSPLNIDTLTRLQPPVVGRPALSHPARYPLLTRFCTSVCI